MVTGWQYINNIWYYFNEKADDRQGAMYSNTWAQLPYNGTTEWYYFNENGTMMTDWLTQDEKKYYLYPIPDGTRGRMLTGWQKLVITGIISMRNRMEIKVFLPEEQRLETTM